jgi:hypothetical protein
VETTTQQRRSSDIAPDSLLVASVGSATATVVLGRFGLAGTLLGAARRRPRRGDAVSAGAAAGEDR